METMVRDAPMLAARRCGSVFLGLCDSDVGALVHSRLLEPGDKPKFVYWLTLNSHVPFVAKDRGALGCRTGTSPITNATVCELTELWGDVFDAIAVIAADTRLPPTDILVVGDHHTPLWERAAKDRFTLGLVDWYMLRKAS